MAEYPGRIEKLFELETEKSDQEGKYTVKLFKNGESQIVDVDDYFPCRDGKFLFS